MNTPLVAVVDDDQRIRELLAAELEDLGAQVLRCRAGEDLLTAAVPTTPVRRDVWIAQEPLSAPGAQVLRDLGVRSVALMTNNPRKVVGLENDGIKVTRREPHEVEAHEHNRDYLKTKQSRLGHLGNDED